MMRTNFRLRGGGGGGGGGMILDDPYHPTEVMRGGNAVEGVEDV